MTKNPIYRFLAVIFDVVLAMYFWICSSLSSLVSFIETLLMVLSIVTVTEQKINRNKKRNSKELADKIG